LQRVGNERKEDISVYRNLLELSVRAGVPSHDSCVRKLRDIIQRMEQWIGQMEMEIKNMALLENLLLGSKHSLLTKGDETKSEATDTADSQDAKKHDGEEGGDNADAYDDKEDLSMGDVSTSKKRRLSDMKMAEGKFKHNIYASDNEALKDKKDKDAEMIMTGSEILKNSPKMDIRVHIQKLKDFLTIHDGLPASCTLVERTREELSTIDGCVQRCLSLLCVEDVTTLSDEKLKQMKKECQDIIPQTDIQYEMHVLHWKYHATLWLRNVAQVMNDNQQSQSQSQLQSQSQSQSQSQVVSDSQSVITKQETEKDMPSSTTANHCNDTPLPTNVTVTETNQKQEDTAANDEVVLYPFAKITREQNDRLPKHWSHRLLEKEAKALKLEDYPTHSDICKLFTNITILLEQTKRFDKTLVYLEDPNQVVSLEDFLWVIWKQTNLVYVLPWIRFMDNVDEQRNYSKVLNDRLFNANKLFKRWDTYITIVSGSKFEKGQLGLDEMMALRKEGHLLATQFKYK
ncbi:hypothetical protein RFI_30429, partial [Reticulomyxa filosa]